MGPRVILGLALCLIGGLWIGQGVGLIGGSFMTGQTFWAVMGGIAFIFGATLLRGAGRARRQHELKDD